MKKPFEQTTVSIAMVYSDRLPYDAAAFSQMVEAALAQDCSEAGPQEVIIVDDRGADASPDFLPEGLRSDKRVVHLAGNYANRAAKYNAAIDAAKGEYLICMENSASQVLLKKSAARVMVMASTRLRPVGMIYSDYERIDSSGCKEVHLLDWHEARLRDMVDFGLVAMYPLALLREVGKLNEKYNAADQYDLRLKVSAEGGCRHISNRFAGSLYSVTAPATTHNVFDYLLAGKDAQLEMEDACTEHLKRIGAYLAPGAYAQKVEYSEEDKKRLGGLAASVVIPVNNRPEFIGRAIESVQAQTVAEVEAIVVVNGGADDPTVEAVKRYQEGGERYNASAPAVKLVVVDINNLGLCLNTGLSMAAGKYYVQLDSDDRLKPDAVEKLVAVYESDPTIGMVIGSYEVATLNEQTGEIVPNKEIPVVTHDEWTADNGRNNLLRINGAGAPRSAHIKAIADVGWFGVNDDDSCRNYGEDYDLVLRMSERYTIGRVWDPIYEVIRHSGGTDHAIDQAVIDRNDNAKDHMRLEALKRRRALNAG